MRLALVQTAVPEERQAALENAKGWVRRAAKEGAHLVLLPELFAGPYFCQTQREKYFAWAEPVENHSYLPGFQELARELKLHLPVSFYERCGQARYNSLAWINPEGNIDGVYRKTHIPDGPGYQEKYYFNPGDSKLEPWKTSLGNIGTAICWDQWYPECARSLVLRGADIVLYPTAIGSEPEEAGALESQEMWQRAMIGHAVCNACYVGAANRVGTEGEQTFYGTTFIADYRGDILDQADKTEERLVMADVDFQKATTFRAAMGFFRDRRPSHYGNLLTLDGRG